METFKDAYFCSTKFKVYHPTEPLYLVLCGNDPLERNFGNMRMKAGHSSFDVLGLIHCSHSISKCQDILDQNPNWLNKRDEVMKRLCLDYSNPSNWDAEKLKMEDVNVVEAWCTGRLDAELFFKSETNYSVEKYDFSLFNTAKSNCQITFLKLNGTKVGLNPLEVDWSLDEHDNNHNVEEGDDNSVCSISDYIDQPGEIKISPQVEVDGNLMYKASVIRQLFTGEGASKDRLRRVQGLSRFSATTDNSIDLHDLLLVGDPVLVYGALIPQICIVQKLLVGNKHQKSIEGNKIENPTTSFVVHESLLEDKDNKLVWTGKFKGDSFKVQGKNCQAIKPDILQENLEGKYFFEKQLIIDLGVQFHVQENSVPPSTSRDTQDKVRNKKDNLKKCFICKKTW